MQSKTTQRLPPVPFALGVVTALLYAFSLKNGLTNWDDLEYVEHNPFAAKGLSGVVAAFTTPFDGSWYPLTHATYTLLQLVAGPSPFAHHLLQLVLFAFTVALVPAALRAFKVPTSVGVLAALLWAAHPLRVEAVSWAANLKDTLSAFGVIASFAILSRGRRGGAVAAFIGALLAKSTVFPLAFLVPFADWLNGKPLKRSLRGAWPFVLPAVVVAGVAAMCHLGAAEALERTRPGGSLVGALPSVLFLPWWYLGRVFWPAKLQAIYDFKAVGWSDPRFFLALGLWSALAVWIATRRGDQRKLWLAGAAAWWLPFAPVTGLVPLGFHTADRYALLPSLSIAVLISWVVWSLTRERFVMAVGVTAVVALVLAVPNVRRQAEWHDSITLWESNRAAAPQLWAVHFNLAGAYGAQARWKDAMSELRTLREMTPERVRLIGDLFFAQAADENVPGDALLRMRERLRAGGYSLNVLLSVADEALTNKAPSAAELLLNEAQKNGPRPDVEVRLAKVAQLRRNYELVLMHATKALDMNAALEGARVDIVIALVELGRVDEALRASAQPAQDPKVNALLMGARGYALYKSGRVDEAQALLTTAKQQLQMK